MAFEKRWERVPYTAFTSDGTANGCLTIPDNCIFKVKQIVCIGGDGLPSVRLEVKEVSSDRITICLGPEKGSIRERTDISAYTTALNANIKAEEQSRSKVPEQEVERITYEEEPTVARRTILVDKYGDKIGTDNPLPVNATISLSDTNLPTIYNVDALVKGTEYSQLLPNNTTQLYVRARGSAKLQLSYVSGTTGTNFLTVTPGTIYFVDSVRLTNRTIYFQSNKDDTVVEIATWSY